MRKQTAHFYQEAVHRALTLAFACPETTPGALAEAAGFSPFHFSRMLAGRIGESPGELLRRLRLERAAQALHTGQRVTEVALDAGYESLEAFSRAFRGAFGQAPSVFVRSSHTGRLPSPNALHWSASGEIPTPLPHTKGTPMPFEIQDDVPPWRVVALRHIGPYNAISPTFGRLQDWLATNQVPQTGPGVAIYHDDPDTTAADQLRSDACAIVASDFTTDDPTVTVQDLPGGRYAVATHLGPYSGLDEAWGNFLGQALPASNATPTMERPMFEVYVNDCRETPPDEVRTDLYVPIL